MRDCAAPGPSTPASLPKVAGRLGREDARNFRVRNTYVVEATLLVLAGGDSRRMGRPKAWLEVGETTLLRWLVERLAPAFSDVLVSFAEPEQLEAHVPYRLVFDRHRHAGPLAGIEAGLQAARTDVTFAVACDMPYVTSALTQMAVAAARGCDAAIPRIAE